MKNFEVRVLLLLLFASIFISVSSQSNNNSFPIENSEWKGFTRHNFEFEGKNAHIVLPNKVLNGNPWVWRARFPEWHTEMDSILLSEGFYIAFH